MTEWLGRVPKPGEAIERDGIRVEVLASDEMRVEQVRLSQRSSKWKRGKTFMTPIRHLKRHRTNPASFRYSAAPTPANRRC